MQGDIFIQDMTEDDRKSINDYRLKHPDFEGKWMQYRYAEKIPLNDINSIMEPTPIIRGMIACANAHIGEEDSIQKSLEDGSSANYFITPQNPEKDLIMLIEQELDLEVINGEKYVRMFDFINWIEAKKSSDQTFIYEIKKTFLEYYKKHHKTVKTYEEIESENLKYKDENFELKKRLEKFIDPLKTKKKQLIQQFAKEIFTNAQSFHISLTPTQVTHMFLKLNGFRIKLSGKKKLIIDKKKRVLIGISFSSVRNYVEETKLFSSGKSGKLSSDIQTAIETFSSKILSLQKYQNIKSEVEQMKTELLAKDTH